MSESHNVTCGILTIGMKTRKSLLRISLTSSGKDRKNVKRLAGSQALLIIHITNSVRRPIESTTIAAPDPATYDVPPLG